MWTAILGIIVGWILSEGSNLFWKRRSEKKQIRSTRFLIKAEIDQNIGELRRYWDAVKPYDEHATEIEEIKRSLKRMRKFPLPKISHKLWESQMPHLTLALAEDEIKGIIKINESLDRVKSVHSELSSIDFGSGKHGDGASEMSSHTKFLKIVLDALQWDNPIQRI